VKLSERREEASRMFDGRNQTGPKIWLILGAVIAVAVVLLVVLYGGGGRIRNRRNWRLLN
jgi:hypothetical protein